jgi:hypothetical protein
MSDCMKRDASSGELGFATAPNLSNARSVSGICRTETVTSFRRSRMLRGVLAGARGAWRMRACRGHVELASRLERPPAQFGEGCAQSALTPADLTTRAHRSTSALNLAANSAGGRPTGSAPPCMRRFHTSSLANASSNARLSATTAVDGVPLGTKTPCQPSASNPGRPDSAIVGRSGRSAERLANVIVTPRLAAQPRHNAFGDLAEVMAGLARVLRR